MDPMGNARLGFVMVYHYLIHLRHNRWSSDVLPLRGEILARRQPDLGQDVLQRFRHFMGGFNGMDSNSNVGLKKKVPLPQVYHLNGASHESKKKVVDDCYTPTLGEDLMRIMGCDGTNYRMGIYPTKIESWDSGDIRIGIRTQLDNMICGAWKWVVTQV